MLQRSGPVPGKKLVQPVDRVIGDAGEHVGKPGLRIDAVSFAVWISVNMLSRRRRAIATIFGYPIGPR